MTTDVVELLKMLANATVTYYQCNGHTKAEMNLYMIQGYREQLQSLGQEIPSDEQLLGQGTFNGEGAW